MQIMFISLAVAAVVVLVGIFLVAKFYNSAELLAGSFYGRTLEQLLRDGTVSTSDSVLVVAGGPYDRDCMRDAGFTNVTISNLDARVDGMFAPFKFDQQDIENLSYPDNSFDFVVVHAGLHHCRSPHRAFLEMFRVSRKCALAFEGRHSITLRIAKAIGFTIEYELEAVAGDNYVRGGLNNGPVPNFIYRWTEKEVTQSIASYDPAHENAVQFFHGLELPTTFLERSQRKFAATVLKLAAPLAGLFIKMAPSQCNKFAFAALKTGKLQPWMQTDTEMLRSYVESHSRTYDHPGGSRDVPYDTPGQKAP